MSALQPYQPLRQVAQDLYCVDGEWYDTPFRRRMTVVRVRDGSLVIHSAIRMEEKDFALLDQLGPVRTVVAPNFFHVSEAKYYAQRYPQARVYVPGKIAAKSAAHMRVTGATEVAWPLEEELPRISFAGTLAAESVFVHRASRTLIMTDMAMNLASSDFTNQSLSGLAEKLIFAKWNGILDQFGPSYLTRFVAARSRASVRTALRAIAGQDFDRVIVNHGKIVETDGKRRLLEGYARIYGPDILA